MPTKRRRPRILSSVYRLRHRAIGDRAFFETAQFTEKREAIRAARRVLVAVGGKAEVKTAEGALLYQAHRSKDGRFTYSEEL